MAREHANDEPQRRLRGLRCLVGNTPLLAIDCTFRGRPRRVYAKAENLNLTGSIKDRMALHILRSAYASHRIQPGDTIAEATSGNTGISFAAIGRALGHPVVVFMPDWMSPERTALIRSLGAQVVPVSREQGGFMGCIRLSEEMAQREPHVFLPSQFSNHANVEAHATTTGPEIWWQLYFNSVTPDAFVAGVGTGGTITGVGEVLKQKRPGTRIVAVEPAASPVISGGKPGPHKIQGWGPGFIPKVLDTSLIDETIKVSNADAGDMGRRLTREEGILSGISCGGAAWAAREVARRPENAGKLIVVVLPDTGERYLTTWLFEETPAPPPAI